MAELKDRPSDEDALGMPKRDGEAARVESVHGSTDHIQYRLYKRRFAGLVGMVVLNLVGGMAWPWFGPISNNMTDEFGITLDQVNWLGNIMSCIYLPVSLLIPPFVARFGLRRCCEVGAVAIIIAAWVRYAGTAHSLSVNGAYALLVVGQFFAAIAQPIFQVLPPVYSEAWFDLQGRTTATMIASVANPVGAAIGQLLSPLVGDTRQSILVLGIIETVIAPCVFLIASVPPSPPTYAASTSTPSIFELLRAMIGMKTRPDSTLSRRERFDFWIVTLIFGTLVAATNTFSILTAQIFQPVGYSDDISGLMGACLLLTGLVAAVASAPLFDRVFTHHLGLTAKILIPIVACAWLSLIWAVRPHNTGALFAIMAIIGGASVTMLPVGLELGCDLTRNADASSALLWFTGNLLGIVFVLSQGALRASDDANPPLNMRRALIFNGAFIMTASASVFFLRGKQVRKELDKQKLEESRRIPLEAQGS